MAHIGLDVYVTQADALAKRQGEAEMQEDSENSNDHSHLCLIYFRSALIPIKTRVTWKQDLS